MTGASLNGSRPAQISTSAWRGENACRSIPKRAKSKRLAAVAMNSMAQQAVPKGIGHRELARAQLTRSSSRVSSQFGLWPETSFVARTCFTTRASYRERRKVEHRRGTPVGMDRTTDAYAPSVRLSSIRVSSVRFSPYASRASIPLQGSPLPHVHVAHGKNQHEHQHLHEQEPRPHPRGTPVPEDRRPGEEEHGLDVEDDEEHRDEVELHGEPLARVPERRHAALV